MSEDGEPILYITKDEFKRRMLMMNTDWTKVATRYAVQIQHAKKEEDSKWFQKEMESITDDIKHNNEMIARAEIEKGYGLFWINNEGMLMMRRCSKEEHDAIYKSKMKIDYLV